MILQSWSTNFLSGRGFPVGSWRQATSTALAATTLKLVHLPVVLHVYTYLT
ncbi:hypothetical protein [Leadbettera azotonutricia]|uniref:hypothetical protein n=1 Tax=Leadbettera azotonutricia TaxID=150829 RepID=UPI00031C8922|nr:hypothetical protein [Leadbettera azotonutricia]